VPIPICVPVTDGIVRNRTPVPSFDLSQDCHQVVRNRLAAFTCVLNFNSFRGYRVGKVRLALRAVEVVRGVKVKLLMR
jgi:hypothetical protein